MKLKLDATKVISITAALVGAAATLLSNVSQKKEMEETVAKEVAKALNKQK